MPKSINLLKSFSNNKDDDTILMLYHFNKDLLNLNQNKFNEPKNLTLKQGKERVVLLASKFWMKIKKTNIEKEDW
jgi:hypothetical protein